MVDLNPVHLAKAAIDFNAKHNPLLQQISQQVEANKKDKRGILSRAASSNSLAALPTPGGIPIQLNTGGSLFDRVMASRADAARRKAAAAAAAQANAAGGSVDQGALTSQLQDYIDSVLGPEQQQLDPLSMQMMIGQLYQPLMSQADQAAQLAAQGLRAGGQPALADQYLGMAGHVANAYQQQAMAFPAAYAMTQSMDRAAKAQELRNQIGQQAFGVLGSDITGAGGIADVLKQAANPGAVAGP